MQLEINETKARSDLVEVGKLMYERGYICGVEGNISIKLNESTVLTTPAGSCKGRLKPDDLVKTDISGKTLVNENGKPSTELKMHLTAYQQRPDIQAIVHAHPTAAVAFSVSGRANELEKCVLPEIVCTLGNIPTAPYATPSTEEVSNSIKEIVKSNNALILDHHGALTLGENIWDAYYKLETLEHYAQTMLIADMLGGARALKKSQVEKLLDVCSIYGVKKPVNEKHLLSSNCSTPDGE